MEVLNSRVIRLSIVKCSSRCRIFSSVLETSITLSIAPPPYLPISIDAAAWQPNGELEVTFSGPQGPVYLLSAVGEETGAVFVLADAPAGRVVRRADGTDGAPLPTREALLLRLTAHYPNAPERMYAAEPVVVAARFENA